MRSEVPVIAVDGPSGSGKGTLAAQLAEHLGWHLLDSGALYRVVAAVALQRGLELADGAHLAQVAATLDVRFRGERLWVDEEDLTERIREVEVGNAASQVAALEPVRDAILDLQLAQRRAPGLVADGRDMGTVVFPNASLKVYLDASLEERAQRRYNQLKNKGLSVSFRDLLADLAERDARDKGRAVAPLVPAADAWILDSTELAIEQVVSLVIERIEQLGLSPAS